MGIEATLAQSIPGPKRPRKSPASGEAIAIIPTNIGSAARQGRMSHIGNQATRLAVTVKRSAAQREPGLARLLKVSMGAVVALQTVPKKREKKPRPSASHAMPTSARGASNVEGARAVDGASSFMG